MTLRRQLEDAQDTVDQLEDAGIQPTRIILTDNHYEVLVPDDATGVDDVDPAGTGTIVKSLAP